MDYLLLLSLGRFQAGAVGLEDVVTRRLPPEQARGRQGGEHGGSLPSLPAETGCWRSPQTPRLPLQARSKSHKVPFELPGLGCGSAPTRPTRSWRPRWRTRCTTKVEAAYARSDLFERRRVLMEQGRSIWRAAEQAQRA